MKQIKILVIITVVLISSLVISSNGSLYRNALKISGCTNGSKAIWEKEYQPLFRKILARMLGANPLNEMKEQIRLFLLQSKMQDLA